MGNRRYLYRGRILNLALEDERYEIVEHKDAVAVLAERDGRVLFVRQYRPAVGHATLEIPAGLIEPGEAPQEAARRELAEEAQLTGRLEYLTQFYVSPGFTDERTYLFRATHLTPAPGTPDEDEDLVIEWHDPRAVLERVKAGSEHVSASTLVGLMYAVQGAR